LCAARRLRWRSRRGKRSVLAPEDPWLGRACHAFTLPLAHPRKRAIKSEQSEKGKLQALKTTKNLEWTLYYIGNEMARQRRGKRWADACC
jgi:hypothetical protein